MNENPPVDRHNLAYIFLVLHGIGFLLPWNVFINAKEYFVDYKLNTTISIDADYRLNFMSYIGFASHFPGLCFAAWNTFCQSRKSSSKPSVRFSVAMAVEISVLLFTITFALVDTSRTPGLFFALTMVSVILINCCVGIHQTLTFGLAATLPMKYSNAVIVGSNACGMVISMVNIATKLLASVEGRTSRAIVVAAIAYFFSAIAIVVACLISFFWLRRLRFVRYYSSLHQHVPVGTVPSSDNGDVAGALGKPYSANGNSASYRIADSAVSERNNRASDAHEFQNDGNVSSSSRESTDPLETEILLSREEQIVAVTGSSDHFGTLNHWFKCCCFGSRESKIRCRAYWSRYAKCLAECWPQCLNVWCVFFCSLSVFPAIQARVAPLNTNYFIPPLWFVDITCFLFFNLFSMLGCILCNWVQFPGPRHLWIVVWTRTLFFIPFFLFCNFGLAEPKLPVLVANDHVYVFATVVFAFTNGYLSCLAMMYAPKNTPPERAELAGMLAAFFLILGVCSGVYTSRALVILTV